MFMIRRHYYILCEGILFLLFNTSSLNAQDWQQVWADEFNQSAIDRTVWSFDKGPANDCLHYFTDREENARIEHGILHIIALKESYQGFDSMSWSSFLGPL